MGQDMLLRASRRNNTPGFLLTADRSVRGRWLGRSPSKAVEGKAPR